MGKVLKLKQKRKKNRKLTILLIVLFVLLLLLLWLNSRFFAVQTFEIEGNHRVSDETVLENLKMKKGMNLIWYCIRNRDQNFELDPLISTADIYIHWPDTIRIKVEERQTMGYIPYMGMYLCIDSLGCVLGSEHQVEEGTPVLTGIQVDSFSLGETVDTSNTERFAIMLDGLAILDKYGLSAVVREIAVASSSDIHFYTDTLDISCGTAEELDRKIALASSVLREETVPSGILHVEEPDGQIYVEAVK